MTTLEDTPVTLNVLANDGGGPTVRVTAYTVSNSGSVTCNALGSCTYTPGPDFNGADVFFYMVRASDGTTDVAGVDVTVLAVNDPPVARIDAPAGDVVITAGEGVVFEGSVVDPDGESPLRSRSWGFPGGTPAASTLEDPGRVTFAVPGTYTVVFSIVDQTGAASSASRSVRVQPPANQPPETTIDAPAGAVTTEVGRSVFFAGTARDPDGRVVSLRWTFGGGAADRFEEDPGAVTFPSAGTFTVTFNAVDDRGTFDPTPATVTIVVRADSGQQGGGTCSRTANADTVSPGSDARVDGHDVIFVLRARSSGDPRADVNCDGIVDDRDVQVVLSAMGESP